MTDMLKTGVYSATIEARSSDVPAPADELSYTVSVNVGGGVLSFEDVKPQDSARWSSYMPDDGETVNLVPFEIGRIVTLHVLRSGNEVEMVISDAEFPEFGGCPS